MISNNFEKKNIVFNLFKKKNFKDTIKVGVNLLQQLPNDTQLIYLLGLSSINLEKFVDAEIYFEKLVSIKKSHEFYYTLANIQKKLKKYSNAILSYEQAIAINPNFSEAYNNLGNTKKLINKKDEAISHYKKAISLKENNIEALFNLSTILKEKNNYEELVKIYEKILNFDKNNLKTIYNLGSAHLFLGNFSKGREYFINALKIDKLHIPSFRNYISITKVDKNNKIFNDLENLKSFNLNNENKILLNDALSKGYFDLNNTELGFKHLNQSNLIKKKISKFSMKEQENKFEIIKKFFLELKNTKLEFNNKLKYYPIFIVGMPRSGTTLLEQILASHSKIHGAGELNFLQKIIEKKGIEKIDNNHNYFSEIRNYYYEQIKNISQSKFIIDKLPLNFRWIGFISKSFPEAKIIHIERNPMAVCWSNYKTLFIDKGMDFSLDQKDIANFYAMYLDLMKFWRVKFKDNILDVNYENLVKDFEIETKKILKYLDLNWENQMKNYALINRAISTASYKQVRENIKKNTSNQWKKYRDYLKVMEDTLLNHRIRF